MLMEALHLLSKVKAFFQPKHELPLAYGFAYGKSLPIKLNNNES